MRLVNPGAGEISDRLTILSLKVIAGRAQGQTVTHFESERAGLLIAIRPRTLNGKWFDVVLQLAAVNALLWHAEEDLRGWRIPARPYTMSDLDGIRILAFRIQALNDERAALVRQINQEAGDPAEQEKI